jgi:fucose permease
MFSFLLPIIYLAYLSLGLPDALLGSAWPIMYQGFNVPLSYAGIISMIIALGTIISSLQSARLTDRLGTGKVTFISVMITAVALFGFSITHSFGILCLWAIPYGLGAGSVDASINNYVAIHYASRHMSWLHSFWGIGAALGPSVMGLALSHGQTWHAGYRYIAILQVVLTVILFLSLPQWKSNHPVTTDAAPKKHTRPLKQVITIPGVTASMVTFFCYCAIEQTTGLWASSYLALVKNVPTKTAATLASLFYIGIAIGRTLSGFLTFRFNDKQMVRIGEGLLVVGVGALLLPLGNAVAIAGFILIGFGCAPVYPSIIHATPTYFGTADSQAVIGIQMASAYVGTCLMPPFFGLIANHFSVAWLPVDLGILLVAMFFMHERLIKKSLA